MRILYVEDHREVRETIALLMEAEGRTVVQCETGEQALEQDRLAHERGAPFDVVVTDVSLPGMSGTDLAHALLATNRGRWIILCSGYELGAHAHAWGTRVRTLLKPFEIEALDALLTEVAESLRQPQGV
jgi:CheY-like chemotaxis protein